MALDKLPTSFQLKYEDFYKFVMSVGLLLFLIAAIMLFLFGIGALGIILFLLFLFLGIVFTLWAYERWFAKQRIHDAADILDLELKSAEVRKSIGEQAYLSSASVQRDPIKRKLELEGSALTNVIRGFKRYLNKPR